LAEHPQVDPQGSREAAGRPAVAGLDRGVRPYQGCGRNRLSELPRLCADPDTTVRQAMASCPRLPAARIATLLNDPELAEHAAADPALPVEQMRRILDNHTQ